MSSAADPLPILDAPPPTRPPLYFKRVRIRNYKSIAFCDVALEPLTLFVGRNGAGKSNFLDALSFLRDFVAYGLSEAVDKHGGPDGVMRRGAKELEIEVVLSVALGDARGEVCDVTFGLEVAGGQRLAIKREWGRFSGPGVQETVGYDSDSKTIRLTGGARGGETVTRGSADSTVINIGLDLYGGKGQWQIFAYLYSTRVYNFTPEGMRPPQRLKNVRALDRDGANLATVIVEMQAVDLFPRLPPPLPRIKQYLEVIVPQIEGFDAAVAGGYSVLEFAVAGVPGKLPAASMSDGTLRVLATLAAAFQYDPMLEAASAVGFEEPESALHPAAAHALIAALDEASLRRQILLTTHSSALLDAEEVTPERVRVVEYIDGVTRIGLMDEVSVSIVRDHLSTVGELERGDRLEIDAADLDRQHALATRRSGP